MKNENNKFPFSLFNFALLLIIQILFRIFNKKKIFKENFIIEKRSFQGSLCYVNISFSQIKKNYNNNKEGYI